MFKLGWEMLFSRRKWLLIITFALALIIAVVHSIFSASESIKTSLKENAYNNYGEHSGAIIGVSQSKEELSQYTDKLGQYGIIDNVQINDQTLATVGWMDDDALQLGRIELQEGNFPQSESEIAIESAYLELIDSNWEIGEERFISFKSGEKRMILSGIIQNYSSKWTVPIDVVKGKNDFPNMFLFNEDLNKDDKSNNFIFKFNGSIENIEKQTYQLNERYPDHTILMNERLYYRGLSDYDTISNLSFIFQIIMLVASLFCIVSLFSYFDINQVKKLGILKAVGANNINLYKIRFFQCLLIFFISLLISIPFQIVFHYLIIKNTYGYGQFTISSLFYILILSIIIFGLFFISAARAVRNSKRHSINNLLKGSATLSVSTYKLARGKDSFFVNQLARQLLSYPKQFVLIVLTLSFAILTITFSIFLQEESRGIWKGDEGDYYLTPQEVYSFDIVEGLTVLTRQGSTFSIKDIKELEKMDGIAYIEKQPFMVDVHPLMDASFITPTIQSWINTFDTAISEYDGKNIIPNVNYVVMDQQEFEQSFPDIQYSDFVGKILLDLPTLSMDTLNENLRGKEINFIRSFHGSTGLETEEWKYEILDVINEPLTDDSLIIEELDFNIILDEETAIANGIFNGYKDIVIYVEDNISKEQASKIESAVYGVTLTVPGSLFQDISEFMIEDMNISYFVGYLGKFAFAVSVLLSAIGIIVIVYSKYQTEKRKWGIYLSIGMSKKKVLRFLQLEMFSYLILSASISLVIFSFVLFRVNHIYPFSHYVPYYLLAIFLITLLLIVGSFFLRRIINKQSVYSLIREEE